MISPAIVCFCKHDTGRLGLEQLFALKANIRLAIVQSGFEDKPWFKRIQEMCKEHKVQLIKVDRLSKQPEIWEMIQEAEPSFAFTIMFTQIIPNGVIRACKNKLVNFHPSLLPKYRGPHPVNWAIVNGEEQSGVTAHFVTEVVDGGPILCQTSFPILFEDDNNSIQRKIDAIVVNQIRLTYNMLLNNNNPVSEPQDETISSYFRRRTPDDGQIDWFEQTSTQIYNLIRALQYPLDGAFCKYKGKKYVIRRSQPVIKNISNEYVPGTILSSSEDALLVKTIDGLLQIEEVEDFQGNSQVFNQFNSNDRFENG